MLITSESLLIFSSCTSCCVYVGWVSEAKPYQKSFQNWNFRSGIYRISSYKTLPRIIPAILIIPSFLTILCSENVVYSNKTRIWRLCEIIIPAGLIWGNTVYHCTNTIQIFGASFVPALHWFLYYMPILCIKVYSSFVKGMKKFCIDFDSFVIAMQVFHSQRHPFFQKIVLVFRNILKKDF